MKIYEHDWKVIQEKLVSGRSTVSKWSVFILQCSCDLIQLDDCGHTIRNYSNNPDGLWTRPKFELQVWGCLNFGRSRVNWICHVKIMRYRRENAQWFIRKSKFIRCTLMWQKISQNVNVKRMYASWGMLLAIKCETD